MILFVIITAVEVMIALFCHGGFVRYYLGDVIVVWAVYCFVQIFSARQVQLLRSRARSHDIRIYR